MTDGTDRRSEPAQDTDGTDRRSEPAQDVATAETVGADSPFDLGQSFGGAKTIDETVGRLRAESGQVISPAFDAHHAPDPKLVDDCVHCGFCLPTCPTYVLFGEEMDSPRGRIYLMKEGLEGEAMGDTMVRHFDLCLGCMACVTACPSGVQYDKLIEATRQQVERRYERAPEDRLFRRLIFGVFPYPQRLRALAAPLGLYQRLNVRRVLTRTGVLRRLPVRLQAMESLMPVLPRERERVPALTRAQGTRRARVGMLTGCVQSVFFPGVNAATARVLAADGCDAVAPRGQGCCGALSLHAGREEEAQAFARRIIERFEGARVDAVIVNAAGCGSAMKEYGYLLRDDPVYAARARGFSARVKDVSEYLDALGAVAARRPLPITAVYHDACHLRHAQGIRMQPRAVLKGIPDLVVKEVPREKELCCGSAGIYNMVEPGPAMELGERKARNVLDAGAQLLVAANPGCLLQIHASLARLGHDMPLAHPIEVLDASIRGASAESLLR